MGFSALFTVTLHHLKPSNSFVCFSIVELAWHSPPASASHHRGAELEAKGKHRHEDAWSLVLRVNCSNKSRPSHAELLLYMGQITRLLLPKLPRATCIRSFPPQRPLSPWNYSSFLPSRLVSITNPCRRPCFSTLDDCGCTFSCFWTHISQLGRAVRQARALHLETH